MIDQPESAIATWAVPDNAISIEYPVILLRQIDSYAGEGFRRLSRGGMEVGGVLFGRREGSRLRLEAWRPISCEYSRGPCLSLSENDKGDLDRMLAAAARDPKLRGLEAAGWFVSHTRSGLAMLASDREIADRFFGEPWQVTLVLRPEKNAPTRAGFFARDPTGAFPADAPGEFSIDDVADRRPAIAPRPPGRVPVERERRMAERRAIVPPVRPQDSDSGSTALQVYAPVRPSSPLFSHEPIRRGHHWGRLVVILAVLAGGGGAAAYYYLMPAAARQSLSLDAEDAGGQLHLRWDPSSDAVRDATRGVLEIKDGDKSANFALDTEHVHAGRFTYLRNGGDVDMRLTVFSPSGPVTGLAHFAGPPVDSSEVVALRKERDQLRAQVSDLENQLEAEQRKSAKLEQMNKLKETLLELDNVLTRRPAAPPQPPK